MKIRLLDGSGSIELKYLVEDVDRHGKVRIYFRVKGQPKVCLKSEPGSEEFIVEYREALAGKRAAPKIAPAAPAARGSVCWIIRQYYEAATFKSLDPQVRKRRRVMLDAFCERRGDLPFNRMEARHIRKERDRYSEVPGSGNDFLKAIRGVFAFAKTDEYIDRDPSRDVPYFNIVSDGFHTWTVDEVRQYEARYPIGTKARLALALCLFTGTRVSDARKLGPQMERDGWLHWTETKGRAHIVKKRELPILPELRQVLDASGPFEHLAYLVTEFGKPFSVKGLSNRIKKWCVEAGLPHCSVHGLRKAGATIAAENGATEMQLMAIYGWESPKQAALYTKKARRRKMAGAAMHYLVPQDEAGSAIGHNGGPSLDAPVDGEERAQNGKGSNPAR